MEKRSKNAGLKFYLFMDQQNLSGGLMMAQDTEMQEQSDQTKKANRMETQKQAKARVSFNYQCNKASKCRHEKYQMSCFSCHEYENCEIQKAIEKARAKMY